MATPHVSGVAAMLMQQGITDPGGDRERPRTLCDRSAAPRAATTRSGSDWSTRATRCADWDCHDESRCPFVPVRGPDARLGRLRPGAGQRSAVAERAVPDVSPRAFAMFSQQQFAAEETFDGGLRRVGATVLGRRRAGGHPAELLRRGRLLALRADRPACFRARRPGLPAGHSADRDDHAARILGRLPLRFAGAG